MSTNDGHLDIFGAAGGSQSAEFRSFLILGTGRGEFIDATAGAGLGDLVGDDILGASFGDLDNDGDLDLLVGWGRSRLFLNDGGGAFTEHQFGFGIGGQSLFTIAQGDFDRDGRVDVLGGGGGTALPKLYRNISDNSHWITVELVGTTSNRNGIGARVVLQNSAGVQTRQILGGTGYTQDEIVAHFGLGIDARIDHITVHWPSGAIERFEQVPADRRIRIVEAFGSYAEIQPVTIDPVDAVISGRASPIKVEMQAPQLAPASEVVSAVADLSALGILDPISLTSSGGRSLQLDTQIRPEVPNGAYPLIFRLEQRTAFGPVTSFPLVLIDVLPADDLSIIDGGLATGWTVTTQTGANLDEASVEVAGRISNAIETETRFRWSMGLAVHPQISTVGLSALHIAAHVDGLSEPATGFPQIQVFIQGKGRQTVDLYTAGLVPGVDGWQSVTIPLTLAGPIAGVSLSGNQNGRFHIADMRLVSVLSPSPITAVTESGDVTPDAFSLSQNYPNPFNASTSIAFELQAPTAVSLTVHNLAGQRVATLISGVRGPGTHRLRWNGQDNGGRGLASGAYFYRLVAGEHTLVRKLMLLR